MALLVPRYFLSDTMRGLISVSLLVASAVAAPQWDGLKSLVKNLSGDDKPGEVNGDYEQVPYEVVAKFNVSLKSYHISTISIKKTYVAGL